MRLWLSVTAAWRPARAASIGARGAGRSPRHARVLHATLRMLSPWSHVGRKCFEHGDGDAWNRCRATCSRTQARAVRQGGADRGRRRVLRRGHVARPWQRPGPLPPPGAAAGGAQAVPGGCPARRARRGPPGAGRSTTPRDHVGVVTTASFRAMGCEIVIAGAGRRRGETIRQLFADRERTFSRFLPDSELTAVNAAAGRPTVVSSGFADMLGRSLALAAETGGLVGPTVGGALQALGYTRDHAALGDDLAPAGRPAPAPGWRSIKLAGRVLSMPAGCALDLNGIVKSATVDDALALLDGEGFVSAGGDLAV